MSKKVVDQLDVTVANLFDKLKEFDDALADLDKEGMEISYQELEALMLELARNMDKL